MKSKDIKIEQHGGLGVFWCIGWLFSIGFLKLGFWKGLLALIVWPYFLGVHFEQAHVAAASQPALEQSEMQRD